MKNWMADARSAIAKWRMGVAGYHGGKVACLRRVFQCCLGMHSVVMYQFAAIALLERVNVHVHRA